MLGKSLQAGLSNNGMLTFNRHYVAFLKRKIPQSDEVAWVLYNDEKVVKADNIEEMKQFAYIYILSRSN